MKATQIDFAQARKAATGFAINVWDSQDEIRHHEALSECSAMIEAGFQVVGHTTVIQGNHIIQTVIMAKYSNGA